MICSVLWDMPKEYPFDEKEIDKEGVEPETLVMTPKELNFRQSFDAPNESILHRRSIVSMKMQELGIRSSLQKDEETAIPKDLRLSSIILKEQINAMGIEESEEGEGEDDDEKDAEWKNQCLLTTKLPSPIGEESKLSHQSSPFIWQ